MLVLAENGGGWHEVKDTLQGTNISHLGKRKIIFKMPLKGDMLVPRRVVVAESYCFFFLFD